MPAEARKPGPVSMWYVVGGGGGGGGWWWWWWCESESDSVCVCGVRVSKR